MDKFTAHGKFLLSAEYAILHGAKGLAIPLNKGQTLNFTKKKKKTIKAQIRWTAFDKNNYPWLEVTFEKETFKLVKASHIGGVNTLSTLLKLVPKAFFGDDVDYHFETYLEFDKAWGWGSSSTLVSLLAQCTSVNPHKLYDATFKGSGFDIACATASKAITYCLDQQNKPLHQEIEFSPSFKDRIYFIYLGHKQSSLSSIKNRPAPSADLINKITLLTDRLIKNQTNEVKFCKVINEHESLISTYLKKETVKSELFKDSKLTIKSLGAWGGDFVMAIGDQSEIDVIKTKGFHPIFKWDEVVLKLT